MTQEMKELIAALENKLNNGVTATNIVRTIGMNKGSGK